MPGSIEGYGAVVKTGSAVLYREPIRDFLADETPLLCGLQISQQAPGRTAPDGVSALVSRQIVQERDQTGGQSILQQDVFHVLNAEGFQRIPAFQDAKTAFDLGLHIPNPLPPARELRGSDERLTKVSQVVVDGRPGAQHKQDVGQDSSGAIGSMGAHHPDGKVEQRFGNLQQPDGGQAVGHVSRGQHRDNWQQREMIQHQVDLVTTAFVDPVGIQVLVNLGQFGRIQDQGSVRDNPIIGQTVEKHKKGEAKRQQFEAFIASPVVHWVENPYLTKIGVDQKVYGNRPIERLAQIVDDAFVRFLPFSFERHCQPDGQSGIDDSDGLAAAQADSVSTKTDGSVANISAHREKTGESQHLDKRDTWRILGSGTCAQRLRKGTLRIQIDERVHRHFRLAVEVP